MKYAGQLTVVSVGLLATTLTLTTIAQSRAKRRTGAVDLIPLGETADGYNFTELASVEAIRQVEELVDVTLDPWLEDFRRGDARVFVMAQIAGYDHVTFVARRVDSKLDLVAAFGPHNTLPAPTDARRIEAFLEIVSATVG